MIGREQPLPDSGLRKGAMGIFPSLALASTAPPSAFDFKKVLGICELPHIGMAKDRQAQPDVEGMQMLAWIMAVVVAIGLIWSVAAMSNLVPVVDSGSTPLSGPAE
jgi:hypothetical protein